MIDQFIYNLKNLSGSNITRIKNDESSAEFSLSNGAEVSAGYWRLLKPDGTRFSSFDHNQKYGLKTPFNTLEELTKLILGQRVDEAFFNKRTADLEMSFDNQCVLQIFSFTGYEDWEITFPDGTGQYSNYL